MFERKISTGHSYLGFFTKSLEIKSFAWSEMTSKLSSSKSQSAAVTLVRVSLSSSPTNGDKPLSLWMKRATVFKMREHHSFVWDYNQFHLPKIRGLLSKETVVPHRRGNYHNENIRKNFQKWHSSSTTYGNDSIRSVESTPQSEQPPVGLIAQLAEHCTDIAEIWVWVTVQAST